MFRKMTIVLAMAVLVACSACNSVTGPMTSDDQTPVTHPSQSRSELSDPGDGSGGSGGEDIVDRFPGPPRNGRGNNQHDDGNGTGDPVRRGGTGTGGR